jgi:four helix bundle protein
MLVSDKPKYDLEERMYEFAGDVRKLVKRILVTDANIEDSRQLIRASGSIGANYIEANNALGKKDFLMRLRISRKQPKESRLFLRLLDVGDSEERESERARWVRESEELAAILGSIISKSE